MLSEVSWIHKHFTVWLTSGIQNSRFIQLESINTRSWKVKKDGRDGKTLAKLYRVSGSQEN